MRKEVNFFSSQSFVHWFIFSRFIEMEPQDRGRTDSYNSEKRDKDAYEREREERRVRRMERHRHRDKDQNRTRDRDQGKRTREGRKRRMDEMLGKRMSMTAPKQARSDAELERMSRQFIEANCRVCRDPATVEAPCDVCPSYPAVLVGSPRFRGAPAGFSLLQVSWPAGVGSRDVPHTVKLTLAPGKARHFAHSCVLDVYHGRYLVVGQTFADAVPAEQVGRVQRIGRAARKKCTDVSSDCEASFLLRLKNALVLWAYSA